MAKMKPFIVRGNIQNGLVSFPLDGLNFRQKDFVRSCQTTINQSQIPKMTVKPTEQDSLAYVMYQSDEDFCGMLAVSINTTPDEAWAQVEDLFNQGPQTGLKVGRSFTRKEIVEMGTSQAGMMMDMLNEGGIWPWANAGATFKKQGDRLVVIETF
jgi:hypothetical protein